MYEHQHPNQNVRDDKLITQWKTGQDKIVMILKDRSWLEMGR